MVENDNNNDDVAALYAGFEWFIYIGPKGGHGK